MDNHFNGTQAAEPRATAGDKNTSWVARRSRLILALLSGLYLLWLFLPAYYSYGSLQWLERFVAILIFGGALGWVIAVYLASSHKGGRLHPVHGLIAMFAVNTCLNVLIRLCIYLFDPFELPGLDIKYDVISRVSLLYGVAGVFAYALMFQYMHRLNLRNLLLFFLAWHALTSLAAEVFTDLAYDFHIVPVFQMFRPFTSGLFHAVLHMFLVSAGLFAAWWFAKGAVPMVADAKEAKGA